MSKLLNIEEAMSNDLLEKLQAALLPCNKLIISLEAFHINNKDIPIL